MIGVKSYWAPFASIFEIPGIPPSFEVVVPKGVIRDLLPQANGEDLPHSLALTCPWVYW
jgi:hypothetical protein